MKNTSKDSYNKGQIAYWTHRNIIVEAMKDGLKRGYKEIAFKVRLKEEQVWKRVSELESDGRLINVGTVKINGRENTLYQYNFNHLPATKKQSLKDWLKKEHPEILNKYKILVQHEL